MTFARGVMLAAMLVSVAGCGSRGLTPEQRAAEENAQREQEMADYYNRLNSVDVNSVTNYSMVQGPAETAPEVRRPANGVVRVTTTEPRVAQLRIITPPGEDAYFFKLVNDITNEPVVTLFAAGGQTISTRVPIGVYRLRYAIGRTWRGPEALFGNATRYSEAGELLNFTQEGNQVSGFEIDLTRQIGGNLQERSVARGSF